MIFGIVTVEVVMLVFRSMSIFAVMMLVFTVVAVITVVVRVFRVMAVVAVMMVMLVGVPVFTVVMRVIGLVRFVRGVVGPSGAGARGESERQCDRCGNQGSFSHSSSFLWVEHHGT